MVVVVVGSIHIYGSARSWIYTRDRLDSVQS